MSKPFSEACENNKAPILGVINRYFGKGITVLEIGSYTTQHVQFFADMMPEVIWQPTDTAANMPLVQEGLADIRKDNILPPLQLDVTDKRWPVTIAEGIYSANCLHIMSESHVVQFFRGAGVILAPQAYLCVYGPFKYKGEYTSESNARFDTYLKEQDEKSGIRDFERVNAEAVKVGMTLVADHDMPANNRLLVWRKILNYFPV